MNTNKGILATILTVIGGIIVAIITNIDKLSVFHLGGWIYLGIFFTILIVIWLQIIFKNKVSGNIKDHSIFTQFMYWERYLAKTFELKDIGKQILFRDILNIHMKSFKDSLLTLHDDTKNIHNMVEFKNKHVCILYQIVDKLEKHFNSDLYSQEDKKLLNIVIPKFNKWCGTGYDLIIARIEEICESNLYVNNTSRNVVILLSYQIMLSLIILDASKTLNDLNGELSGLKFKGVLIE